MSNVTVEICQRRYTIACAEGEESHIEMLTRIIDGKLAALPNMASQSEARTLLFASLLLADELYEAQAKGANAPAPEPDVAEPLEKMAERLESLATQLEAAGASS